MQSETPGQQTFPLDLKIGSHRQPTSNVGVDPFAALRATNHTSSASTVAGRAGNHLEGRAAHRQHVDEVDVDDDDGDDDLISLLVIGAADRHHHLQHHLNLSHQQRGGDYDHHGLQDHDHDQLDSNQEDSREIDAIRLTPDQMSNNEFICARQSSPLTLTGRQAKPQHQQQVEPNVQHDKQLVQGNNNNSKSTVSNNNNNNSSSNNNKTNSTSMPKQRKLSKCRHCSFETDKKVDYWLHARTHIRPEKLLACELCQFVTEYKHHLEYHQRNHSGYKPFKCDHCDYRCVNKSMLNSHKKSHSSVYEYECGDCKYATKYVHSLKQHLRKYNHQTTQHMIDVYGRKRGPKSTSSSSSSTQEQQQQCSVLDLRVNSKIVQK